MELFVNIFFLALAALGLFLGILFFTPIRYTIKGGYRETLFFTALIRRPPLLSLTVHYGKTHFLLSLTILGIPLKFHPGKSGKEKKKKKENHKKKKSSGPPLGTFRDVDLLKSILTFSRDILKMIGPKYLEIRGKLGFDEPHYNGYLAALNWFLKTSLPQQRVKVDLEPVWEEEYADVAVTISGEVTVCLILYRMIRFFLARETRNFWKNLWAAKRRRAPARPKVSYQNR